MKSHIERLRLIDIKLLQIESELSNEWPIVPRTKLIAGHQFLSRLLKLLVQHPDLTMDDGTLQVADEFAQVGHLVGLTEVTTMQPNIAVFNWHIFHYILSFNTPVGDFINEARDRAIAKRDAEAMKAVKYDEDKPAMSFYSGLYNLFGIVTKTSANEDVRPLLKDVDDYKRYDAC